MQTTPKFNLKKAQDSDNADLLVFINQNMDLIEQYLDERKVIIIQSSQPTGISANTLWINTNVAPYTLNRYNGSTWNQVGGGGDADTLGGKTYGQIESRIFARGTGVTAPGTDANAEGSSSIASGNYSHASGRGTKANGLAQTAIGQYNEQQGAPSAKTDTDYVFIVGNGTGDGNRSNAATVNWRGDLEIKGNIYSDSVDIWTSENLDLLQTRLEQMPLNTYRSGKDANGQFVTVEYFRQNGTLFSSSVLSGTTDSFGNYPTRTQTFYDTNGATILKQVSYNRTFDVDGDFISEVIE
jgi:hypothetical protein